MKGRKWSESNVNVGFEYELDSTTPDSWRESTQERSSEKENQEQDTKQQSSF